MKNEIVSRYRAPDKSLWQGRKDGPEALRFHEVVKCVDLENDGFPEVKQSTVALIGFACDEGIKRNQGRTGAVDGPTELRKSLAKLPFPQKDYSFLDLGDITCTDGNLEKSQYTLGQEIERLIIKNIKPIVIGGGHETAWGHYQGIALGLPNKKIGIINIDAHYDLRPLVEGKGNSGTSFLQIAQQSKHFDYTCIGLQSISVTPALLNQARQFNAKTVTAENIHLHGLKEAYYAIDRAVKDNEGIYLTICLDVFAAPYAPGVSAPQPLGLTPWQVIPLLKHIVKSGKLVSFDIAELSPKHDRDGVTAMLAASLVAEAVREML